MVSIVLAQANLSSPDLTTVDRARRRLVVALMEPVDNRSYGDVYSDATVVLDRLSDMLDDPAVRLGW